MICGFALLGIVIGAIFTLALEVLFLLFSALEPIFRRLDGLLALVRCILLLRVACFFSRALYGLKGFDLAL